MNKAKLLNRVIIETNNGDRAFLLLEGDIFSEPADVYLFNSYQNDTDGFSGSLVERLKQRTGENKIVEKPFYFSKDGITVGKIAIDNGNHVLLLHTNLVEYEAITLKQYKTFIDIVFTSLTALEGYGVYFETVAFPVLIRNGLQECYEEAIAILIGKAMDWLKVAESTKVLKYILFRDGDANLWNDALNQALGRSVMNIHESSEVRHYQNDVLSWLKRFPRYSSYWEDTLLPIHNALQRDEFRPEVLAAFSRKLVEVFTYDLCKQNGIESLSLEDSFKQIKIHNLLDEWKLQILRQIRAFGNPAIHRPNPLIGPRTPKEKDVVILLVCLCRLLETVHDFVHTREGELSS